MSTTPSRQTPNRRRGAASKANLKPINLALQGGGAHGAFTWGILDKLLEDGRLEIEGVSGTSAGAMNAVVLADGLMENDFDIARQHLHDFWFAVSEAGKYSPIQRDLFSRLMGNWSFDSSPSYMMFDLLGRLASPYELNPLNINPLRELLEEQVDFDRVRACSTMKLFISATNVETGRVKVFRRDALTADMVMASACLPFLFQAVEIDGIPYWDGGYMGNPVIFPFNHACASDDVLIIQINPIERKGTPKSARDIMERVNEITFNSSLLKELRAVEFVSRLIDGGQLDPDSYKKIKMHLIHGEALADLGASSKLNAEWAFLTHLRDAGRDACAAWLDEHFDKIGKESSLDLRDLLQLGPVRPPQKC